MQSLAIRAKMWLLILSMSSIGLSQARTIYPVIPSELKECYNSTYILTKDNLLPMTSTTLIAIIRKVEDALSSSLGIRTLTPAILNRFRFDGIQRNPEVSLSDSIIPYTVKGSEFSLFKTQFEKIIPQTSGVIPNGTLTYLERCTLHAMLSDTIDVWDRGDSDSVCNSLSQLSKWNLRVPREVAKLGDAEVFDPKEGPKSKIVNEEESKGDYQQMMPLDYTQTTYAQSSCPLEDGVIYNEYGSLSAGIVLAGVASGTNQQSVSTSYFTQSSSWLRRRNQNGQPSYNNNGGGSYPNYPSNTNYGESGKRGQWSFPNQGGYRHSGSVNTFNQGSGYGGIGNYGGSSTYGATATTPTSIDSRYGATLAGSLALVALLLGPEMGTSMTIGEAGGWNSTVIPKYYFLKDYTERNALTDARIRGSVDGLLIALSVQNWLSASSNLKLSQILHMYYTSKGVFSTSLKGCSRTTNIAQLTSQLSDQVYAFATLLQDDVATSAQLGADAINYFSSVATSSLSTYIQTLSVTSCTTTSYLTSPPVGDVTIVIDCNLAYKDLMGMLQTVADKIDMWKYGSNLTLVNGKDGTVMVESMKSPIDLQQRFNYTYFRSVAVGFDYAKTLTMMKLRYRMKLETDKIYNSAGGYPRILIFMTASTVSLSDSDKTSALNTISYFNTSLPDVRILYITRGSRDAFTPFVANSDRDIMVITSTSTDINISLRPLFTKISHTPRRIIDPTCGKSWSGSWYNQVSLNGYLNPGDIHFYRIDQNYFFRNANALVKITSATSAPTLTVCKSRTNSLPMQNVTSGDTACQQLTAGNTYQFTISDSICYDYWYATQCNPIYLSISSSKNSTSTVSISTDCTDLECLEPDMIKYTIAHSGLTCYSGSSKVAWSSAAILLALMVKFLIE